MKRQSYPIFHTLNLILLIVVGGTIGRLCAQDSIDDSSETDGQHGRYVPVPHRVGGIRIGGDTLSVFYDVVATQIVTGNGPRAVTNQEYRFDLVAYSGTDSEGVTFLAPLHVEDNSGHLDLTNGYALSVTNCRQLDRIVLGDFIFKEYASTDRGRFRALAFPPAGYTNSGQRYFYQSLNTQSNALIGVYWGNSDGGHYGWLSLQRGGPVDSLHPSSPFSIIHYYSGDIVGGRSHGNGDIGGTRKGSKSSYASVAQAVLQIPEISGVMTPGGFQLIRPTGWSGWKLQTTRSLIPPVVWEPYNPAPSNSIVPLSDPQRYYRLVQP